MEGLGPKLLSWAVEVDENTIEQARQTASMPFVEPHVALMPDAHSGKGAAVGTVIPTLGAVIPAAVGVDIGCGMAGVETRFTAADIAGRDLAALREAVQLAIPLSHGNYNAAVGLAHTAERIAELEGLATRNDVDLSHSPKWREQLGSLGSGNHFIELCLDERDHVWLFLHSGSRGVGNKIAQRHIKIAQQLCKRWWIDLPSPDLAYLAEGTHEFTAYIKELAWAQKFAALNRADMLDRFGTEFARWIGADDHGEVDRIISHHNYTKKESGCFTCIDNQRSDSQLRERLLADPNVSIVRDFLAGYRPSVHSCGGLLLSGEDGVRAPAPSKDDALARKASYLVAQTLGLAPSHSRSESYAVCECAYPGGIAAPSNSFSNTFGRDFCRRVAIGIENRILGTVLEDIFFEGSAPIYCTSGHDIKEFWLTRKGAVDAHEGVKSMIPGSMGTCSYVVEGKGCVPALHSAPHGAGRRMSRTEARKRFTAADLAARMEGIEYRPGEEWVDEIPDAYKDIDTVMAAAEPLVEVLHTLRQILNVKGT